MRACPRVEALPVFVFVSAVWSCPLCLCRCPLTLLTVTYCKQRRSLCPHLSSCVFCFCLSFIASLGRSVRPLWDIVFVQTSPLYPHKPSVSLEDGQRMFSHRASPRRTSWRLSHGITMTSSAERQSGHWARSWTRVTVFFFLRVVSQPHQSLLNHKNVAFPRCFLTVWSAAERVHESFID